MSVAVPKDFKDLDAGELYRSAVADFALPVEEEDKGKKKVLLAAFVEGGVSWADYVAQHPELTPEDKSPAVTDRENDFTRQGDVITSQYDPKGLTVGAVDDEGWERPEADEDVDLLQKQQVIVQQPLKLRPEDEYLIKMVRDNPLYQVRGYTFTADHPYALVKADDAMYILEKEDGFRQAYPQELQEFYG